MNLLERLQNLDISQWIATSDWGYPLLLSAHSIGMAAVIGILTMLDFRVLGYGRGVPFEAFEKMMTVAWIGLAINAASGALLFMADATRLIVNWAFLLKLVCIAIGGWISWMLWRNLRHEHGAVRVDGGVGALATESTSAAKVLAVLSLAIWFATIVAGRLIAYVIDHQVLGV